jgi:hypothetical protein
LFVNYDSKKGCTRSDISLTKGSALGNWPSNFGSNGTLLENLTTTTSSFAYSNATISATYTTTGWKNVTGGGGSRADLLHINYDRPDQVINWRITGGSSYTALASDAVMTTVCSGASIDFSSTANGPSVVQAIEWSVQETPVTALLGTPTSTNATFTYVFTNATTSDKTFQIKLRIKDGCCGWSRPVFATILVKPDPQWTSYSNPTPTSLCEGGTVAFSVSTLYGTGGTTSWIRSDNVTPLAGTETTVTTGDAPGVGTWYYRPSYTPTATGCNLADGTQTTVAVSSDPTWNTFTLPNPTSLCVGASVAFSATVTGGLGGTITWVRSNNVTPGAGTEINVTTGETPPAGTWYYRRNYAPTGSGCNLADGAVTTVVVTALPTVSISQSSICAGQVITLLSPTSGGTWTSSDVTKATVTNAGVVTGVAGGSVTFTFTSSTSPNCSNTTSAVTINQPSSGDYTTWTGSGATGNDNWDDHNNWTNCKPNINIHAVMAADPQPSNGANINSAGINAKCKTLTIQGASSTSLTISSSCTNCLEIGNP